MKNNRIYIIVIGVLFGIIAFLLVLLFMGDSGKYCVPIIREPKHIQGKALENSPGKRDSLKRMNNNNR